MRPVELMAVLEREFASVRDGHHTPAMLWGPPGVGKSQMIAQVAARHGAPVIDVRLPQMEPSDLQYAVAAALVSRAIRAKGEGQAAEVYGRILDYAGRFPSRGMGVMLVSDMHRAVGQGLFDVPQFAIWAKSIADVMLFES